MSNEKDLLGNIEKGRRNAGSGLQGTGQQLWRRAKKIIPGGNSLLSKRPEMFLPELWPSYFSKAKGVSVWDLDGQEFIDMSQMSVGTCSLGYAHAEINDAVCETIAMGSMATLNCPEEVFLAEKLVEMHPWGDMVRYARSGGEANAIAVRIARAATGRDAVAICGYHGWHDWYLATNLTSAEGLRGHLLPGLDPKGVPRALAGTVHPFAYGDIDKLRELVKSEKLAAIKMEVARTTEPNVNFLRQVRELASTNGIVLIFDECTTGFRESFGGLHLNVGVTPDIAMFGKALGNGFPITAVLGIEAVMDSAQKTFISSTFWTDRTGPVAALKTLEVMAREASWEHISEYGRIVKEFWRDAASDNGLDIDIAGINALPSFTFRSASNQKYKTLVTQHLLEGGVLAGSSMYPSLAHSDRHLAFYKELFSEALMLLGECARGSKNIDDLLIGPTAHSGFARLA